MTPSEELALRKRQLAARDGKAGYAANVEALKRRIIELEGAGPIPSVPESYSESGAHEETG